MAAVNKPCVVDSCVFVAFYHSGDQSHREAVKTLKHIDRNTLLIHPYVVQEVTTVLAYRIGKHAADIFLNDLLASSNIRLIEPDIVKESEFFLSLKHKISFTDSSLILLCKLFRAELITFDQQMKSVYKKTALPKA